MRDGGAYGCAVPRAYANLNPGLQGSSCSSNNCRLLAAVVDCRPSAEPSITGTTHGLITPWHAIWRASEGRNRDSMLGDAGSACKAVARISKRLRHCTRHWHAMSLNSCA